MENIEEAYKNARRGKTHREEVRKIDKDPGTYLKRIQEMLINKTFISSEYRMFKIHENGKERDVADLPFFPDRIVHWAVMQVIEPIITRNLISQTYAALPGKGTHAALTKLKGYVKEDNALFALKMDVKKFFPSIDKTKLEAKLRRRIKDEDVMWLLCRIIYDYPNPGVPIGNYTSQYFANFYLSDIDHYMKESYHCKYYLRYMDDIVILGWSKRWLHRVRKVMDRKLTEESLTMKGDWQVFPINDRGVDFVGYRVFRGYTLIRTRTKSRIKAACRRIAAKMKQGLIIDVHDKGCIASYSGCLGWCDSHRLRASTLGGIEKWTY